MHVGIHREQWHVSHERDPDVALRTYFHITLLSQRLTILKTASGNSKELSQRRQRQLKKEARRLQSTPEYIRAKTLLDMWTEVFDEANGLQKLML